ncbi:hypothetical protein [Saccharibacillus alkalitolerans]|uniref:Nucleotide pyrophosphohydrolase n=1 Tax=Saccharibacillus alkalitolerans TaxID=2705290 RepID=A0ABX0FCQ6_9BACL|nr:hypothetical protein [Saccharibacillus alkalitolerans]NGZ77388.1 hypothetical protein [Saccharibacillus alkalitolerans]
MNEMNRLLERVDDWTEELLLRGAAQFASDDAKRLERLADEAQRLGMGLLEELLRRLAKAGERSRLSAGSGAEGETAAEELAGAFFRLCGYAELARGGSGESSEEDLASAAEEAES